MGVAIIELIIGGVLIVICTIIGLFIGNIILFDSLALAIGSGFAAHGLLHIHPALSIVIGLVVLVALYGLQRTKVGFYRWPFIAILGPCILVNGLGVFRQGYDLDICRALVCI